ncbi:MAG: glycogen/starch/alpha-glucan phosphorylase [Candidatus Cloacimonetes bacterium]|nr:glycogen/starch/alpha-glucan phosphorylase [Candidatus Cloacimonadota bacterium]
MNLKGLHIPEYDSGYREKLDPESIIKSFAGRLKYSLGKDKFTTTPHDFFLSFSFAIRDRLTSRWIETQRRYYKDDVKRVYYLSMEFLLGRLLGNALINLGAYSDAVIAMNKLNYNIEELREYEWEAALGNGGLGRLAACFLDSMATLQIPAYGYGIRYEYGMFFQHIVNGFQVETPDNWLRYTNPWEIQRPEYIYPVKFMGKVNQYKDYKGLLKTDWIDTDYVMAVAYDYPIPGYKNDTVNTLRLWSAKSTRDFNLDYFNSGNYIKAVESKNNSEVISKVLYPNDNTMSGKILRLKQEYFFVSATLQDIMRRFEKQHNNYNDLPQKVSVQLNDTHPALAVADLLRILIDEKGLSWESAWGITEKVFAYTNHTILPEALEKWRVELFEKMLPRHLQIIYEINRRFLDKVWTIYPGDIDKLRNLSIIEEGSEKKIQMAKLAIIGSHSVNGVSAMHTELLKDKIFKDFHEIFPEKFNNKTNGITQRRWLKLANPRLSNLLKEYISLDWALDLRKLKDIEKYAEDKDFCDKWKQVKMHNKITFTNYIEKQMNISIDPDSLFDFQVKRIHEYKRQFLNILHTIYLYNRIRKTPYKEFVPRTVFFAGKAAPGYTTAKLIIKLINSVSHQLNNDPVTRDFLKVVYIPNYSVSIAEMIFPAAELSQQISTAGTEASGTGNMKFALNGALTIGTLDGANIEIKEQVGKENIFIFGMNSEEVQKLRDSGYTPHIYYENNSELKKVIEMIATGFFSPENPELFRPIVDSLLYWGDQYMLFADFDSYAQCQEKVSQTYADSDKWTKMSIKNVANMGIFSSDRSIKQYAEEIWGIKVNRI